MGASRSKFRFYDGPVPEFAGRPFDDPLMHYFLEHCERKSPTGTAPMSDYTKTLLTKSWNWKRAVDTSGGCLLMTPIGSVMLDSGHTVALAVRNGPVLMADIEEAAGQRTDWLEITRRGDDCWWGLGGSWQESEKDDVYAGQQRPTCRRAGHDARGSPWGQGASW
jgi:hypothetical protein